MKKFKENNNAAVFTTRFVIDKKSPILFVFHFDDGAWQFSGAETNLADEDFRVVSLSQIIELDNSLLKIADLPLGSKAIRINSNSPWRIIGEN